MSLANPRRSTLRDQTVSILKEAILGGQWGELVPSESELCKLLKVGRNTVRAAVQELVVQKLVVSGGNGRNHRIIGSAQSVKKHTRKAKVSRIIRYLSNEPFFQLGELTTQVYGTIETNLAKRGYQLLFEHEPGIYARFNKTRLEQITSRPNTAGWILFRATHQIQSWFQKTKIPAVITGSAHPGIVLPTVRLDYQGACRHAALKFLGEGHDNLSFVTPLKRVAAEEESVQGFLSAKLERPDARLSLIEHDFSMNSILKGILASRLGNKPVTAYLVMEPQEAISVLNILQYSSIPVPGAASVISRFGDGTLSRLFPNIAHYLFNGVDVGKTVTKTLLAKIENRSVEQSLQHTSIAFQSFVRGGSMGLAPESPAVRTPGFSSSGIR